MADLLRRFPWESHALGPPERWPPELKTSLRIALLSRFPILLWWGPELIMLYNDSYAALIGGKHPWALGRPGRQVWPEIWDVIGPMLGGVMQAERATWSDDQFLALERSGYPEEAYFTFSYSPVVTEQSTVDGVFTVVTETTERVVAHRRLDLLRRLSARGSSASTEDEALALVLEEASTAPADVPFVALCRHDEGAVRWAAASLPSDALPEPDAPHDPLGVTAALESQEPVLRRMDGSGLTLPPWPEPVVQTLAIPVPVDGGLGWALVAGLSPRLPVSEAYRGFLELLAAQIGAVLSGARAVATERLRAEALAELDRAKTAFFTNVSHELRTPLTLILGPLEEALASGAELAIAEVELAHRNAHRLLDLVNVVLDFSSLERGRLDARFAPVDLSRLTVDVVSGFRSLCERAGLVLTVDAPPLPDAVYVDSRLWESVVLNLMTNAFKATLTGSIDVRVVASDAGVELSVSDTGVGIAPVELPKLFDRFYRVRAPQARTMEGTGIGLSMTRELVSLHGGRIAAESEPGVGSTFRVWLPFGNDHLDPDQVASKPEPRRPSRVSAVLAAADRWLARSRAPGGAAPSPSLLPGRGHVLVVDDNADMRDYLKRLLAGDGWRVTDVASAEAALDEFGAAAPDVLVADVMLPGMDGFGLVGAVRAAGHLEVPVILLSARAGKEAIAEGLDQGADDYLVKPFTPAELLGRVRSHAELARARVGLARSRRVMEDLEAERARVARDLHDGVGQSLLALRLALQNASPGAGATSPLLEDVDRTLELLRAAAHDLRPSALDELGLTAALASLIRRVGEAAGLTVCVDLPELDVSAAHAPTVYRIVQEALSNVIRHSGAERVWCRGGLTEEGVSIAVVDDGRGFDVADTMIGHGLSNMWERAAMIGGTLTVRRAEEGGTRVDLLIPRENDGQPRPAR